MGTFIVESWDRMAVLRAVVVLLHLQLLLLLLLYLLLLMVMVWLLAVLMLGSNTTAVAATTTPSTAAPTSNQRQPLEGLPTAYGTCPVWILLLLLLITGIWAPWFGDIQAIHSSSSTLPVLTCGATGRGVALLFDSIYDNNSSVCTRLSLNGTYSSGWWRRPVGGSNDKATATDAGALRERGIQGGERRWRRNFGTNDLT